MKSAVMKEAWRIYRTDIRFIHLSHAQRIAEAMKKAWANIKFRIKNGYGLFKKAVETVKVEAPKTVGGYIIPNWIMHEKALFGMRSNIVKDTDIERKTAKAFKVYGEWFPMSVCERTEIAL